jgi:hypothetical protein
VQDVEDARERLMDRWCERGFDGSGFGFRAGECDRGPAIGIVRRPAKRAQRVARYGRHLAAVRSNRLQDEERSALGSVGIGKMSGQCHLHD